MDTEAALFCILFTGIFFVLGLLYKIITGFRKDICEKIDKIQELFFTHSHTPDGNTYIPRQKAAN